MEERCELFKKKVSDRLEELKEKAAGQEEFDGSDACLYNAIASDDVESLASCEWVESVAGGFTTVGKRGKESYASKAARKNEFPRKFAPYAALSNTAIPPVALVSGAVESRERKAVPTSSA